MIRLSTALIALLVPAAALAQTPAAPPAAAVAVTDAFARTTNPKAAAVFMTLHNGGATACTLAGATTALTDRAELHTHVEKDGVMKMTKVDSIDIPAGADHALAMGSDHIMLMALKKPLKQSDTVSLTLDLGDCGQVPVEAPVDNSRGMPAAGMPGMPGTAGRGAADHAAHGHKAPAAH